MSLETAIPHMVKDTSLPRVQFLKGFSLARNESHWSYEAQTFQLLTEVIKLYTQEIGATIMIDVDLKLPTLKPKTRKLMGSIYEDFRSRKDRNVMKNGWKTAGINEMVDKTRNGVDSSLDSFLDFLLPEKRLFSCFHNFFKIPLISSFVNLCWLISSLVNF